LTGAAPGSILGERTYKRRVGGFLRCRRWFQRVRSADDP
jgi:hypothetical protein